MATKTTPKSVLIIRLSALGDVAITVPVVYTVCRANPDVRFVMVTQQWPATMMLNPPPNLTVVGVNVKTENKTAFALWRLASRFKREYDIDAVADLHSVIRSWVIDCRMKASGIPVVRINKERKARHSLVHGKTDTVITPTVERYRKVFEQLGLNTPDNTFTDIFQGAALPQSPIVPMKEDGERWIAIAPFSRHKGKEYPLERMRQVVGQLAAMPRTQIFLMGGGKKERMALHGIAQPLNNVVNLAEVKHGFSDELTLLHHCDVMLSMDSANMHLASLVGLPVVSVWGATAPACGFMGYHQSMDNVVERHDLDCRPCSIYGENPCRHGDYRCLDIDPERIVDRVKKILDRN